jgi:hypothetical protein
VSFVRFLSILFAEQFRNKINEPAIHNKNKNIETYKMNLKEIGWGAMDWMDRGQDRDMWRALEYTVVNLRVP